jgi:hypothetical protein
MNKLDIDNELEKNVKIQINSFLLSGNLRCYKKLSIDKELDKNVIMQINYFHFLGNLRYYEKIRH